MRILSIQITSEMSGRSVREILRARMKVSAGAVSRAKRREGGIRINGDPVFTNVSVKEGDTLTIEIAERENAARFSPADIPLDILFEDEDLLILNKPAGMTVYAGTSGQGGALANAAAGYLGENAVIHFVSRLDRGTSGIIVIAKNAYIHEALRKQQHTGDFHREYLAIATGVFTEKSGMIDLPIERGEGIRRIISENGKAALTKYEVLNERDGISLVRLLPLTGRTHQLRVHLSSVGHPLLGDWLYGEETPKIARPALHSARLTLRHPVTGEQLRIECPLPEDMKQFFPEE